MSANINIDYAMFIKKTIESKGKGMSNGRQQKFLCLKAKISNLYFYWTCIFSNCQVRNMLNVSKAERCNAKYGPYITFFGCIILQCRVIDFHLNQSGQTRTKMQSTWTQKRDTWRKEELNKMKQGRVK